MPYDVLFKDKTIGRYYLDFVIEDKIILEIKKTPRFARKNIEQVNAYLKASELELAILANFTPTGVKTKRMLNIKAYDKSL